MKMTVDGREPCCPGDDSLQTLARQIDHDLRSPLTAICSYAECLSWAPTLDPAVRGMYAQHLLAEARRLGRMSGNFLIVAAPPHSQELHPLHVGDVVTEVLDELTDVIRLRELRVDWQCCSDVSAVWPQSVLRQLLLAAVEASLEAVPTGSAVKLRLCAQEDKMLMVELTSDKGRACRAHESFAWRAAEVLAHQRGGEATLETEPTVRLCLRLPQVGRVRHTITDQPLERSA